MSLDALARLSHPFSRAFLVYAVAIAWEYVKVMYVQEMSRKLDLWVLLHVTKKSKIA